MAWSRRVRGKQETRGCKPAEARRDDVGDIRQRPDSPFSGEQRGLLVGLGWNFPGWQGCAVDLHGRCWRKTKREGEVKKEREKTGVIAMA